jgi:hypothetical protein
MARGDNEIEEFRRRRRPRNLAILSILVGLIVLFYILTIVRMGGG